MQQKQQQTTKSTQPQKTKALRKFKFRELASEQQALVKGGTGAATETIIIDDTIDS